MHHVSEGKLRGKSKGLSQKASISLRDKFLALHEPVPQADTRSIILAWQGAIAGLYDQVKDYLGDFARDGLIAFETRATSREEPELGEYDVTILTLRIGRANLVFSPVARFDPNGNGRVDLYRQGALSGRRSLIWQSSPEPDGTWLIGANSAIYPAQTISEARALSRDALEKAIDLLLT